MNESRRSLERCIVRADHHFMLSKEMKNPPLIFTEEASVLNKK